MTLLFPVFVAALLGSLHCAGMCGPFVAFYSGGGSCDQRSQAWGHLAYHLGRLTTYTLLGALSGALGAALDLAGQGSGIGRVAAVITGSLMVLWGLALLLEQMGTQIRWPKLPAGMQGASTRMLQWIRRRPVAQRAALLGFSSTLLPCGWLYAFALSAAGTAHALTGAAVMAAFWAGTVPVLLGMGIGVQRLTWRIRRHVPVVSALALVCLGIFGVLGRVNLPAFSGRITESVLSAGMPAQGCHCHER